MEDRHNFGKDRFKDVKPADALGRLSERSRASRISLVLIAVFSFLAVVIALGFIVNSVRTGANTPELPQVEIR